MFDERNRFAQPNKTYDGFLIPPWYSGPRTSPDEIVLADIVLGFFLCTTSFCFAKAMSQTSTRWHRLRKFTAYLVMVWVDWAATIIHSVIGWCVGHGTCAMEPSFWLFLSVVVVWTIEMHCLAQILVNRISLLMFDPLRARQLKIAVFVIISILTASVTVIWIPACMEISPTWEFANDIWDRGEKVFFLVLDVGLNVYFIHLVRSSLISNGLLKYQPLYRFNIIIVSLSILLDVAVIGTTWFPDYWIYIQFRPLTHMVKLYIEMCNAELISRVAQASVSNRNSSRPWSSGLSNGAVDTLTLAETRSHPERPSSRSASRSRLKRVPLFSCHSSGNVKTRSKSRSSGHVQATSDVPGPPPASAQTSLPRENDYAVDSV